MPDVFWAYTLGYGALLSLIMSALVLVTLRFNAEVWLGDYPLDVQERYGEISDRSKRQRALFAIPILLAPIAVVLAMLIGLDRARGGELTFLEATFAAFVCSNVFNLVDLIILDWWLFVSIQPAFVILPGTEGLAGYKDYRFHFVAFLKGLALTAISSPLLAGLYLALA